MTKEYLDKITTIKCQYGIHYCCALYAAMVVNVEVELVSDDSVRVSWDSVDLPEITGYTVYYRQTTEENEEFTTLTNTMNSVLIGNLVTNVEYQFQVVAIAELDGEVMIGQRSTLDAMSILTVLATDTSSKGKL